MRLRSVGLVLLGMVLGVVLVVGLEVGVSWWWIRHNMGDMEQLLGPPRFPMAASTTTDMWKLLALDGKPVELLPGKKVLFISFWATWCGPCVMEMPTIDRLYLQMRGKDILFACISDEEPKAVREFVAKKKWSVPIYLTGENKLPFSPDGYPTNIIIDRQGRVVFHDTGAARWDSPEAISFLNGLLANTEMQKATK